VKVGTCANNVADGGAIGQAAHRSGLDKQVAPCSCLGRAGHDAGPCGVGGPLAKQVVARTTTHDVNDFDAFVDQVFHDGQLVSVVGSQALEDEPHEVAPLLRYRPALLVTIVLDFFRHAAAL